MSFLIPFPDQPQQICEKIDQYWEISNLQLEAEAPGEEALSIPLLHRRHNRGAVVIRKLRHPLPVTD